MRLPLFILTLCFILLRIGAPLHASASTGAHPALAPAVFPSSFSGTGSHEQAFLSPAVGTEKEQLVFDDAEDEDASELFVRKFKFLTREYPELTLLDEPGCPINRSKAAPSFFGRITSKYLVQRVFRV